MLKIQTKFIAFIIVRDILTNPGFEFSLHTIREMKENAVGEMAFSKTVFKIIFQG